MIFFTSRGLTEKVYYFSFQKKSKKSLAAGKTKGPAPNAGPNLHINLPYTF